MSFTICAVNDVLCPENLDYYPLVPPEQLNGVEVISRCVYRVTNVHMHETQKETTRKDKIKKQPFSTARGLKLNILPLRL